MVVASFCFLITVTHAQKYLCTIRPFPKKPKFLVPSRDAQSVCAVAKEGTVLNIIELKPLSLHDKTERKYRPLGDRMEG